MDAVCPAPVPVSCASMPTKGKAKSGRPSRPPPSKKDPAPTERAPDPKADRAEPDASPAPAVYGSPPSVLTEAVRNASLDLRGYGGLKRAYGWDEGRAALEALRPRLATYPESRLVPAKLDAQKAILSGFGMLALITESPGLFERFRKQHEAGEFDLANLELLYQSALAGFQALYEATKEGHFATSARVPKEVVAEASALEKRMQSLCEYFFSDDAEIRPLLRRARRGGGHRDLANDLQAYARIYEMRAAIVAKDTRYYRPTDATDASRLAYAIIGHQVASRTKRTAPAYRLFQQAWTLYSEVHAEVRRVALYLHHHNPQRDKLFPSLYKTARPKRGRGRKREEPKVEVEVPAVETTSAPVDAGGPSPEQPEARAKSTKPRKRPRRPRRASR